MFRAMRPPQRSRHSPKIHKADSIGHSAAQWPVCREVLCHHLPPDSPLSSWDWCNGPWRIGCTPNARRYHLRALEAECRPIHMCCSSSSVCQRYCAGVRDDEPSYQASHALSVGDIMFSVLCGKEFLFESYLDLNEHISHNEKQGCHGIRVGHEKP